MVNIVILISLLDKLHFSIALCFLQFGTWKINWNDCLGSGVVKKRFSLIFIFATLSNLEAINTVVERVIFWRFPHICRLKRNDSCFLILNLFTRILLSNNFISLAVLSESVDEFYWRSLVVLNRNLFVFGGILYKIIIISVNPVCFGLSLEILLTFLKMNCQLLGRSVRLGFNLSAARFCCGQSNTNIDWHGCRRYTHIFLLFILLLRQNFSSVLVQNLNLWRPKILLFKFRICLIADNNLLNVNFHWRLTIVESLSTQTIFLLGKLWLPILLLRFLIFLFPF